MSYFIIQLRLTGDDTDVSSHAERSKDEKTISKSAAADNFSQSPPPSIFPLSAKEKEESGFMSQIERLRRRVFNFYPTMGKPFRSGFPDEETFLSFGFGTKGTIDMIGNTGDRPTFLDLLKIDGKL
jgi:hypothetical protein